jgi:vesicle-fusing ATPase
VKGILLHGPPGTGKTLIARKISGLITNQEPQVVNGPEIMSKYVGQSEENIRNLFAGAKADPDNLHVIIFDEIDAICKTRGSGTEHTASIVNQLLSMIDGVHSLENIFIIAMTNRKDLLDPALIRAGRIELHIKVPLPNCAGRKQIFKIHTETIRKNGILGKINLGQLAECTENYSGAEIEAVVKNAVNTVVSKQLASDDDVDEINLKVGQSELMNALKEITPAFGNTQQRTDEALPGQYVQLTESHRHCEEAIQTVLQGNVQFKRILITRVQHIMKYEMENSLKALSFCWMIWIC